MYRDVFLNGVVPDISDFAIVIAFGLFLIIVGSLMFKKLSRRFAEEV